MKEFELKYYNLARVAVVSPKLEVANPDFNTKEIIKIINKKEIKESNFILFPELSISSYTCGDIFLDNNFLKSCLKNLEKIVRESKKYNGVLVVGCPIEINSILYNCAVAIQKGDVLGIIPKSYLCNYSEYYEERWFTSGINVKNCSIDILDMEIPFGVDLVFKSENINFAIEICEDLWAFSPPSIDYALNGAEIIFNLSASNETLGKKVYRKELVKSQSSKLICAYVYSSSGANESSTDLVYSGHKIVAVNGRMINESDRFSFESDYIISDIDLDIIKSERIRNKTYANANKSDFRTINYDINSITAKDILYKYSKNPFIPNSANRVEACDEILNIQATGLAKRLKHINCNNVVLGLSGGLDSTLALIVSIKAFEKLNLDIKGIRAIVIPGPASSKRTQNNAQKLAKQYGVSLSVININKAVNLHLDLLGHDKSEYDITYENAQARKRTQILMDLANKYNGIVIGTGDLSELALGWCTYNGDHMSMYGVNSGVPKTLVRYLIENEKDKLSDSQLKRTLNDILDTPISPELIPMKENIQETEKSIGSYNLHDFFLYYFLKFKFSPEKLYLFAKFAFKDEYENKFILECLEIFFKRFFANQFKRSTLPDGPKVGSINLSPRGDWRMPSDASSADWLNNIKRIKL